MSAFQRLSTWLTQAAREHWLALLILVVPINWVVYQADKANNIIPMLPLPIVAFVVGWALRPRHVWIIWLGSVVLQWVVMGVWGKYDNPEGETVLSLIFEAFGWMAFGVLFPLWFGRLVRAAMEEGRQPGPTPTE